MPGSCSARNIAFTWLINRYFCGKSWRVHAHFPHCNVMFLLKTLLRQTQNSNNGAVGSTKNFPAMVSCITTTHIIATEGAGQTITSPTGCGPGWWGRLGQYAR
jgi:hypothetical protein